MLQVALQNTNIQKLLNDVENDNDVLALVVFGSFIRGEDYRDIDICIFSTRKDLSVDYELNYHTHYADILDIHFFRKLPLYIQAQVLNEGKILHNKDYELLFDIYVQTIRDYNMFRFYFQEFLEA